MVTRASSDCSRTATLPPPVRWRCHALLLTRIWLAQAGRASLSSSGGEGWGEKAHCSYRGLAPGWLFQELLILAVMVQREKGRKGPHASGVLFAASRRKLCRRQIEHYAVTNQRAE